MHNRLEQTIIEHCAPTLAGVKTGNLIRYIAKDNENVWEYTTLLRDLLNYRGIDVAIVKHCSMSNTFLIYVYRPVALLQDLSNQKAKEFMDNCGYSECAAVEDYIERLSHRLYSTDGFPHEIGVFLGYPLHDVLGFIKHKGQNFQCCGCWKVYENKDHAEKCFRKYKLCSQIYKQLYSNGKSIEQLAVVA